MIDTHYDLLTIAYVGYLSNDYSYLEEISRFFSKNNVEGVIANLYFMSKKEMIQELHPKYYQDSVSVLEMFKKAKQILDRYLPNTNIFYSIEGCDYIQDEEELEKLYYAGLDSFLLVWNTKNQYASGNRSLQGLTNKGKKFLRKAISLGMGIDLSHANPKTFSDMIQLIREEQLMGKEVFVYASHSNARSLCNRKRNLTDQQLLQMKSVGGFVGVFSHRGFVCPFRRDFAKLRKDYLQHIMHIASIVGNDKVMVATDDMNFLSHVDSHYGRCSIYPYQMVSSFLFHDLLEEYREEDAKKILFGNAEKLLKGIRNARKVRSENYDRY